ncbi:tape measure protein [Ornithobacterium rhinotracheale]|uniref:tape measure protein n=1 Tax=Ornithobacterium rhinotracheale TaxID=28251 RepID=UPI004035A3BE
MNSINGNLSFEALLSTEEFDRRIKALEAQIQGVSNTAVRETQRMDSGFKNLALSIGAYFSGRMLLGLTQEVINVRGEFQKTEIALETMLGSSEKAKSLLKDMVDLAAKTPFSLQDITEGTKQLLAFKVPADEVVDTLTRLGNVAAGLSIPLGRIQLVFGQVRAKGKLMGDDLRQFTEAGIPMVAELAKKFGVAEKAIYEMVSAGKVGFNDVKDVLFAMTNEGGMFFNLMEKQSQSLSGKISNLQDSITQMFNEIGEGNEGLLNTGIDGISYVVEHYKELLNILDSLVVAYGTYRGALILVAAAQKVQELGGLVKLYYDLTKSINTAKDAQILFNLVANTNPYTAIAAALGVVVGAVMYFSNKTKELTEQQKALKDVSDDYIQTIEKEKIQLDRLYAILETTEKGTEQYKQAKDQLERTFAPHIEGMRKEGIAVDDLANSYEYLRKKIVEAARAKSAEKALTKIGEAHADEIAKQKTAIRNLIQSRVSDVKEAEKLTRKIFANIDNGVFSGNDFDKLISSSSGFGVRKLGIIIKDELESIQTSKTEYEKNLKEIKDVYGDFSSSMDDSAKEEGDAVSKSIKNKEFFLKQKRKLQSELKSSLDSGDIEKAKELKKQISEIESTLSLWGDSSKKGNRSKATPKSVAEEILPKGSVAEIEKRISVLNDKLRKATNLTDKQRYMSAIISLQKDLEKARKSIAIQSEDEIIDAKIKKWQLYYKAIDQYGKDSDYVKSDFFKDLKTDEISSLADYLQSELSKIDLSEGSSERFEKLSDLLAEISGESTTALDSFNQSLDDLKLKSKNAYEYLEKLRQEQEKLKGKEKTPNNVAKNKAIDDRIKQEENTIREGYEKFKEMHRTFEEQKAEITEKYARLRQEIENDKSLSEDKKTQLNAEIAKEEAKEISSVYLKAMTNNAEWQQAFGELENYSLMKLQRLKQLLQDKLKELQLNGGDTPEAVKTIKDQILKIDDVARTRNPFKALKEAIKAMGDEALSSEQKMEKLNKLAKATKASTDLINGVLSEGMNVMEGLGINISEEAKEVVDGVQTALGGVSDLAEGIATKNPVQILKGIAGVVKGIAKAFNGDRKREREVKRHEQAVKRLKSAYEDLARSMQKAIGTDYFKQGEKSIENLKRQVEELQQAQRAERSKKKRDQGKIDGYDDEIRRAKQQQEDIIESMQKELLKTDFKSFADKLNDAFVNAFDGGQNAVKALGNSIDEMIKGAVTNALKLQFLEAPIKRNLDKLAKKMEGGRIPQAEELQAFARDMNEELTYQMEAYKKMYEGLGLGKLGAGGTELKNAIQGMSEETAGILEGQFNAVRVNTASILAMNQEANNIIADQLRMLQGIRENTEPIKRLSDDVYEILKIVKSSNGKKI